MAIRALATADTPQINPKGNSSDPDSFVFSNGRNTATCAADAAAKPVISVLLEGSEKLFWLAASCNTTRHCNIYDTAPQRDTSLQYDTALRLQRSYVLSDGYNFAWKMLHKNIAGKFIKQRHAILLMLRSEACTIRSVTQCQRNLHKACVRMLCTAMSQSSALHSL